MHSDWEELIPFYVAGTLPKADLSRFESHLTQCADCRKSLKEWQAVAAAVRADSSAQMRDLPPLSGRVLQIAAQQAVSRRYEADTLRTARVRRRYTTTSVTLMAAVFTVVLLGGLLGFMVLSGSLPQRGSNVAQLQTATPTVVPSQTNTPAPTASFTPKPQIIVIEPSATPVSPTPTSSPTRVPPTVAPPTSRPPATILPTRIPPTRIPPTLVPPTLALPTTAPATDVPPATEPSLEAQMLMMQASPEPTQQECAVRAASSGSAVKIYGGPGTSYPVLGTFSSSDELVALGVTDNGWYRLQYPPGSGLGAGWVPRDQASASGDCTRLPLIPVASPASPTPATSATPTVLPFPSDTPTPTPETTETTVS